MPITISNNTISGVQAGGMDGVPFASGTRLLFQQTAAPTGWTKDVTHNDKSMRVVSGTVSSGGSVAFTTAFASQAVNGSIGSTTATNQATTAGGTVGNTTLSAAQMPSHDHYTTITRMTQGTTRTANNEVGVTAAGVYGSQNWLTSGAGSSGAHNHSFTGSSHGHTQDAHNHTFTGTAINMAVQYVDIIIATKD